MPRPLPFIALDERVIRISPDGKKAWVRHARRVESVELQSGRRETILQLNASQGAGMNNVTDIALADDPRAYAYTDAEYSSRLYQIEGVR
jgi:hypothetical protein